MRIRDFEKSDRAAILAMVDTFYSSPGVLHRIPTGQFDAAYDEMCGGGSLRLRGLIIEVDGKPAGFCSLSFSYSTEAGGPVVLIEEVFIDSAFRGLGLGTAAFDFIKKEYSGKAARLRLEVAPDNQRAMELYERIGFEKLPYIQMILEDF